MRAVNVVLLWHMHQPQYRDPTTGRYIMPWTRLHALKDYWGMVKLAEEFPGVHMTFNMVPSLGAQIEEYASGKFQEPWFDVAFAPADSLTPNQKSEILERAFQLNHDNLMARWPRFVELHKRVQSGGEKSAAAQFAAGDWRDLQLLSQLAWMDEEHLAHDGVVSALSKKGKEYTEDDKAQLKAKQLELMARVLPEYRAAAERGQIQISRHRSTTRFYRSFATRISHANRTPARLFHDRRIVIRTMRANSSCGRARITSRNFARSRRDCGLRRLSVSNQALEIAAELGFRWFATDEGVLGRTRNIGFGRDAAGYPENADQLYSPWRLRRGECDIAGFFRDHYLSDLLGFVYSRMGAQAAAEDLHRRHPARRRALDRVAAADAEPDPGRRERMGVLRRQRARLSSPVLQEDAG